MSQGHQDHDTQRWEDDGGPPHPDETTCGHVTLPRMELPELKLRGFPCHPKCPRTESHVPVATTGEAERRPTR